MPEGHTVRRLADAHQRVFGGQPVRVASPQGRFAAGAALLDGRVLTEAEAYGKHLLLRFDDDRVLHIHLGIYGKCQLGAGLPPEPTGAVRLRLISGNGWADLRGPNACELLEPGEVKALLDRLGPDPLRADADPEPARRKIARSRTAIAQLLMDQAVVAGPGNIYRAEVLFRAGVDPFVAGRDVTPPQWEQVWGDLVLLMADGVRSGRIDTVRPEHMPEAMGRPPRVDEHGGEVYVYRRSGQACLICGTDVRGTRLAGRNLFWCPRCQPPAGAVPG
ncbi:Fpg/Nei family DNA glycosylase [Parafrankia sp. FMc2]|uniref:Fpg/Nei family DNA glycosylase n=1 Tax=Parafrankia sp. FMc2 TaxID=3233196 RepID=UPI0034D4B72B